MSPVSSSRTVMFPHMRILNRHHDSIPPGAIDITRRGKYGNPVALGRTCPVCQCIHSRAADGTAALVCYVRWLLRRLTDDPKREHRDDLARLERAFAMVCVCAPADCHGHVLDAYVHEYSRSLAVQGFAAGLYGPWDKPAEIAHAAGLQGLRNFSCYLAEETPGQLALPGNSS